MTNNEISSELDDLISRVTRTECTLRLVSDRIEDIGMIKSDSTLSYEFKRTCDDILYLLGSEADTSKKVAGSISTLSIKLYKPNEVGETHE